MPVIIAAGDDLVELLKQLIQKLSALFIYGLTAAFIRPDQPVDLWCFHLGSFSFDFSSSKVSVIDSSVNASGLAKHLRK